MIIVTILIIITDNIFIVLVVSIVISTDFSIFKIYSTDIAKGVIALNAVCMKRSKQNLLDEQNTNVLCGSTT